MGPAQIAHRLEEEQIYTPAMYEYSQTGNVISNFDTSYPYRWNPTAVANILEDVSYLGHTCNFRFGRVSYKDHRKLKLPKSEHKLIENTHEPIIDINIWEIVQRLRQSKRRFTRSGEKSIFAGIVFCADCKQKLYFTDTQERSLKTGNLSVLRIEKIVGNNVPCTVLRKVISRKSYCMKYGM